MIGLLLDSLSQNTGDKAIAQVMVDLLCRNEFVFDLLSPLDCDPGQYGPIIIGGGHLLRDRGDWFYDAFRVPGHHVLNTAGVTTTDDLAYLAEYPYVSVRSRRDWARVVPTVPEAVVCPCVSLLLQPDDTLDITPEGCIGFHFHEGSWTACGDEGLFFEFKEYHQALIPITHYNGDQLLLAELSRRAAVKQTLVPLLPPRAVLGQIARMRAFVTSSLHGAIFAYSRNVPFLAFGKPDKMIGFMEDRGLQDWIFRDRDELRVKLAALLNRPPDYTPLLSEDLKTLEEHCRRIIDCLPKGLHAAGQRAIREPRAEHRLVIEHQHRLEVFERVTNRLLLTTERIEREVSRQGHRIERLTETFARGPWPHRSAVENGPRPASDLPFGLVESPSAEEAIAGSCEVSGWALASDGIAEITAYVGGTFAARGVYGAGRPDVAVVHPGFPDSLFCGWRITLDVGRLSRGRHELLIQARSFTGFTRDLGVLSIDLVSQDSKDRE